MTGVDLSLEMIELAEEEERREPLGIRYVNTSYAELGMFADASFDAVVSSMALMDGPHFDRAMAECFRVLRPGGTLSFSITHPCFITQGSKWLRNDEGVKINWMVGDYFSPGPLGRPLAVHRRSPRGAGVRRAEIQSHALRVSQHGDRGRLRAEGIEEPRPSEEYCQDHPSQRGWRDHAALSSTCGRRSRDRPRRPLGRARGISRSPSSAASGACGAWCRRRRAVKDAAVVPDDEVALLPLVAVAELGLGHVLQQLFQQGAPVLHR
jgi:hypothetical protein